MGLAISSACELLTAIWRGNIQLSHSNNSNFVVVHLDNPDTKYILKERVIVGVEKSPILNRDFKAFIGREVIENGKTVLVDCGISSDSAMQHANAISIATYIAFKYCYGYKIASSAKAMLLLGKDVSIFTITRFHDVTVICPR